MKITFVMPSLESYSGGIRVIVDHARHLRARGHEVRLVTERRKRPDWRRRLRHMLNPQLSYSRGNAAFEPEDMEVIELDPSVPVTDDNIPDGDVVIATWWETAEPVSQLSASKGAKVYYMQDYGGGGQPMELLIESWRLPMTLITISPWLQRLIAEHTGIHADIVANAVDFNVFHSPPRHKPAAPTVGFVYSATPQKGIDVCVAAVEQAREKIPELRVLSFGPKYKPHQQSVPDYVEFQLRPADDTLKDIYTQCTAWLFGSRREGFGLPILEALACRTPVICTPAGVAADFVKPEFGTLVDYEDAPAMAAAIVRYCELDAEAWRAQSEAGHEVVRSYTWEAAAAQFEACLDKACAAAAVAR